MNKKTMGTSDLLETIRMMIEESGMRQRDIAIAAGIPETSLRTMLHDGKGKQLYYAEQILRVTGYEIALKKVREENA